MRKRLIPKSQQDRSLPDADWLHLDDLAEVEITSEDAAHPIESALLPEGGSGWRAAQPGEQTIRLVFTHPQRIRRILLEFIESSTERTQEFVLRWVASDEQVPREIVRQQWNFSPQGATVETEDYRIDLTGVSAIELRINPDTSGGDTLASLSRLRLA
jgi:hypothetical protein